MVNPRIERLRKVNELFNLIVKGNIGGTFVEEDKLIAYFCDIYGSERRKVLEYLKELELNGKIIREYNEIWTAESLKEYKELTNLSIEAQKEAVKEMEEDLIKDNERGLENEEKDIKD